MKNIQIIFNFDSDIELIKAEFEGFNPIPIPEMIEGSYLCLVENADDFDVIDDFMVANGKCDVISGFTKEGEKYDAKKDKNKYNKVKYKKYLKDKWNYDSEGNRTTKIPKTAWQVMKIYGWNDRILTDD
jgi:hypothetical protein